jgi:iron complex transport system permease protein
VTPPRVRLGRELVLGCLAAVLPAMMLLSLTLGVYPVPARVVGRVLASLVLPAPLLQDASAEAQFVVVQVVRLPRVVLATLAGAGLGLSGAALQGLFRNPLVGPDIIGVSAGAACGGVLAILLAWPAPGVVTAAFAGGLLAVVLASGLARLGRGSGLLGVVLAGVVVSAFFSAVLALAEFLADPQATLPSIVYWLMGSFAGADQAKVATLAVPTLAGSVLLLGLRWRLNLLSLGDVDAQALGLRVARLRWAVVALCALLVAAQVSVSGIVGWVGLIVPHLARMLVGPDHRRLLPAAGLLGGVFTLGVDDLARSVADQELPIGLLTALVGTPVFALLFWRAQAGGWRRD